MEEQNQNYSVAEIDAILNEIKEQVSNDNFIISQNNNRTENIEFIAQYNLTYDKQKEILLNIVTDDFCYSTHNRHPGYENEILYIFAPSVTLVDFEGVNNDVTMYIKFNMIDNENYKMVIVISFHELNYNINYCFNRRR